MLVKHSAWYLIKSRYLINPCPEGGPGGKDLKEGKEKQI
jgi:hypothetical protein